MNCKSDDVRIKEIFQKYDGDKDGLLTEDDFLEFYLNASKEKKQVVMANLRKLHYRPDLKRYDEIEIENVEMRTLPRYLLSRNI